MMWFFFFFGFLITCTGNPASASCPLQISPPRVVVRLEGSFSANCTSLSDQIDGMGWESPYGGLDLTQGVTSLLFSIDSVPAWEIEAMCYMNSRDGDQCTKVLPVTVYKMPDSVSLRQNSTTVKEGEQFAIQCDIVNVAPARNLSMLWHKGNKILNSETFDDSSPSPVSKSSVLTLTAHGDDDGAEIWCEAKLNLWPGEQGPAMMRSKSHSVTVLSEFSSLVIVFSFLEVFLCSSLYSDTFITFLISLYFFYCHNILCCDSPLSSRHGTSAGILIVLVFVLGMCSLLCLYITLETMARF
uniref:Ig-like domain-containing protein n=1 Tax=Astatotilapia calliptera TaxID=8154 RepID=A0A3P8QDZ2_ASTCA